MIVFMSHSRHHHIDDKKKAKQEPHKKGPCINGKRCNKMDKCLFNHICNQQKCKHGSRCRYVHPNKESKIPDENVIRRCRHGKKCMQRKSNTCPLEHKCGYGDECSKKENCYFVHTADEKIAVNKEKGNIEDTDTRMCIHGKRCSLLNKGCQFNHECGYGTECKKKSTCRYEHKKDDYVSEEKTKENGNQTLACRYGKT